MFHWLRNLGHSIRLRFARTESRVDEEEHRRARMLSEALAAKARSSSPESHGSSDQAMLTERKDLRLP